ncbi:hypothetical protein [Gardnerella vaginalis]|uniref:hypothetical protein n=1 Tax=Gardnerella vaginalis TaxID=2702 RepID=UPI0039F0437F
MMNKKAIAAFAAGATLLAGFAMATPAMAVREDNPCNPITKAACTVRVETAQADYNAAKKAVEDKDTGKQALYDKAASDWETAKANLATATEAAKTADDDPLVKLDETKPENAAKKDAILAAKAKKTLADQAKTAAVTAEAAAKEEVTKALGELQTAKAKVAEAKAAYDQAIADYNDKYPAPKPLTFEEQQKAAIADVYAKSQAVAQAEHDFAHARENFVNAYGKMKAAKAELVEAKAQLDAAQLALDDFEASGVKDETKHEHLVDLRDRALANFNRVQNTVIAILTSPEYVKAQREAARTKAAYEAAVEAYKAAYNHAVELNVNPDLLPKITLVDPTSAAFPELSEAKKIYDDALSGKFGAAAQKAVQKAEAKAKAEAGKNAPAAGAQGAAGAAGAAAGKAGASAAAKGELATKGGNGHGGKAGEKLGNAGVGVALTALAASMLAGMGAAVRKMRH